MFLIGLVSYVSWCNANEYLMTGSDTEKFSVYLIITYSCFAILVITSLLSALASRKEAEFLGSSENLLERQNEVQREIMMNGSPELLDTWLIHDDELLFAVELDDEKMSRVFFKKYTGLCSDKTKLQAWFLASSIGNLEVLKEIVESKIIPDLNARNECLNTAAHIAVIYSQDEVLEYFKELYSRRMMNLSLKNGEGKIPFELFPREQRKIVEILSDVESLLSDVEISLASPAENAAPLGEVAGEANEEVPVSVESKITESPDDKPRE